jgi:hypothetical protein
MLLAVIDLGRALPIPVEQSIKRSPIRSKNIVQLLPGKLLRAANNGTYAVKRQRLSIRVEVLVF